MTRFNNHLRRISYPTKKSPTLIDLSIFPEELLESSDLSFLLYTSYKMRYDKFREDPVFPATSPEVGGDNITYAYTNYDSSPTVIGCVDVAYLCSQKLGGCRNYPTKLIANFISDFQSNGPWTNVPGAGIWDLSHETETTDAELAQILLTMALWSNGNYHASAASGGDIFSSCSNYKNSSQFQLHTCTGLPMDQWKAEARRWFKTSLARIQFTVLAMTRGSSNYYLYDPKPIPPQLRGLCSMAKFKSVGWRNVSVWGLFGLLFFSAGVCLASVKTETEELWLVVGTRHAYYILRWAFKAMKKIPWQLAWTRVFHFV